MMEFLNYKVVLQFKDGKETLGFISNVDSSQISIGSKTYKNSQVKDLRVVLLPSEKSKKKTAHDDNAHEPFNTGSSGSISRTATPKLSKKQPNWGLKVGDIKVSDDFDFAANLAMFDKKTVFADFQKNELTITRDRLVSLNKVSDKYDNDENVLTGQNCDNWNKIGSLSQRLTLPLPTTSNHSPGTLLGRDHQYSFSFEEDSTGVPLASPVQLLEIERTSAESYGIDQKAFSEVGATNLMRLILTKILGGSVRLNQRKNHNLPPLVLLLVGSGRSSSRVFALGRHLTNHGVRVLAYVIDEEMVDGEALHQCQLFEKCGGKVVSVQFSELLGILHNQLDTPVELIIDALQGLEGQLSDLFYSPKNMETLTHVVRWANESKQSSKILSIDISSGLDGGSGTASVPNLVISSRYIVSMGIPLSGLVHAYNNGSLGDEITHYVVDVGVPNAVYNSKPHLRKFDKFWFRGELYLRLMVKTE